MTTNDEHAAWQQAMETTDWSRLFHAYGMADDAPDRLRKLIDDDATQRAAAVRYLFSAVLHQGTIYSVTPAALRVALGMLQEPGLRRPFKNAGSDVNADTGSTLAAVLYFISEVGVSLGFAKEAVPQSQPQPRPDEEALTRLFHQIRTHADDEGEGWDSELIVVLMLQAVCDLRELTDTVLAAVMPFVADADADVRQHAINGLAEWGVIRKDSAPSRAAAGIIRSRLAEMHDRDERAALVLALGVLGQDVSPWIAEEDEADEAVRACAALFVQEPRATALLIAALTHPEQVNQWFVNKPDHFPMQVRFTLLGELIKRKVTIEAMLPAALALIAHSHVMLADPEWGRILQVAFPEAAAAFKPGQRPPLPARLTVAQRAVLETLVANAALWDPRSGNAGLALMQVGLTNVREEVAAYIRNTPVGD